MADINTLILDDNSNPVFFNQRLSDKDLLISRLNSLIRDENYAIENYSSFLYHNRKNLPTKVAQIITDIMNEEKIHVFELMNCLKLLDSSYKKASDNADEENRE